jgi:transcription elongation factor Elf1
VSEDHHSVVVSLEARRSGRYPNRRIFRCLACGSYTFKIVEEDGTDFISCANCEGWINEFDVAKNRPID